MEWLAATSGEEAKENRVTKAAHGGRARVVLAAGKLPPLMSALQTVVVGKGRRDGGREGLRRGLVVAMEEQWGGSGHPTVTAGVAEVVAGLTRAV
ncbi:putative supervillin isoform X18 [Sesbania bispinosa]|nr:putative supervillin isoform X18 [Sesbania bispinosa]